MKKLHEIVKERNSLQVERLRLEEKHKLEHGDIMKRIDELNRLENIAGEGLNLDLVQIAESVLSISGNPYGKTDDVAKFGHKTIAEKAIIDIANDCPHLSKEYFGNKRYDGYYQGSNHPYGYGPRHGSTVDEIGLKNPSQPLTEEEKDACIYYLKNYEKIKLAVIS